MSDTTKIGKPYIPASLMNYSGLFSLSESNAMRGIWCLVILLVHIPAAYQNKIQDMVGSFAYIGVTFFFMTSGYGLMLGFQKNHIASMKDFWKRRLPKLLVPLLLANVLQFVADLVLLGEFRVLTLLNVNGFVRQLLVFYLFFWITCCLFPEKMELKVKIRFLYLSAAILIAGVYVVNKLSGEYWPTEAFGFLYGMLLARNKQRAESFAASKWMIKCAAACAAALVLGIIYIQCKHVPFLGDYVAKVLLGLFLLGFIVLANKYISVDNALTGFLGKISYEVYLLHGLAFMLVDALPVKLGSWLFIGCSVLITVILSVIVNSVSGLLLGKCGRAK